MHQVQEHLKSWHSKQNSCILRSNDLAAMSRSRLSGTEAGDLLSATVPQAIILSGSRASQTSDQVQEALSWYRTFRQKGGSMESLSVYHQEATESELLSQEHSPSTCIHSAGTNPGS